MNRPEPRSYFAATADFATGEDSPREFLERCIARIEAEDGALGAFVATGFEAARAAADEASARWKDGAARSAIDGMPVGIKDIMETADMATEQGSPLFAGWRGGRDAAAVAALREAGAAIVGKTVTTEFAATHPRGTRNPWDLSRARRAGPVERFGRGGRLRHGPRGARHPGDRLHPPPVELLRGLRLQAERRRHKPGRQLRRVQPELHRNHRGDAGGDLDGGARDVRTLRRRCRLSRAVRPDGAARGTTAADRRGAGDRRLAARPAGPPGPRIRGGAREAGSRAASPASTAGRAIRSRRPRMRSRARCRWRAASTPGRPAGRSTPMRGTWTYRG